MTTKGGEARAGRRAGLPAMGPQPATGMASWEPPDERRYRELNTYPAKQADGIVEAIAPLDSAFVHDTASRDLCPVWGMLTNCMESGRGPLKQPGVFPAYSAGGTAEGRTWVWSAWRRPWQHRETIFHYLKWGDTEDCDSGVQIAGKNSVPTHGNKTRWLNTWSSQALGLASRRL